MPPLCVIKTGSNRKKLRPTVGAALRRPYGDLRDRLRGIKAVLGFRFPASIIREIRVSRKGEIPRCAYLPSALRSACLPP